MRAATLTVLLTLASALPAAAQDKAKPNTLTPKEIADGWILLFDGETTFGMRPDRKQKGTERQLIVKEGVLQVPANASAEFSTLFDYFELQADYRAEGASLDEKIASAAFFADTLERGFGYRMAGEKWGRISAQYTPRGIRIHDEHDNRLWEEKEPKVAYRGPFTLRFQAPYLKNTKLFLRNIKLRPLETKPLFNGKDLAGWTTFPGKKSQFTVEDGAIVCKNGPGDLQTDGKYGDFVLQVECKTNGKHLNSGIFFRCKPNEYQNGYEAQIHNNFTADPPKEYTVEEFNPNGLEPLLKKTVKSPAVDYGTGAIYRRVPARLRVAKDGEWFTMTIVARHNHFATWINGIQQVDWRDHRPYSDNPRLGLRGAAGHISIQGHDPTTDLSFRNIRIAELPN